MNQELILPSEIPWPKIKGADLEELLYWLFDSMGAKELEWRIGGKGSGAADQGRDLELIFFTPSPDGTLTKQTWWVEAKGRSKTVEPSEVHEAVLNAAGKSHVEVLVIATNANYSNPTRDWVKDWQKDHPRPIVKLWEKIELENLCSKNPLAVIRLHSQAISPQGKVEVAKAKLWDYASFSDEHTLVSLWKNRDNISIDERSLFALVSSEFANGDIGIRSWALEVNNEILISSLCNGLINFMYLAFRANEHGTKQEPLIRAISYLLIVSLHRMDKSTISSLLTNVWNDVEGREYPEKVVELILKPVLGTLQTELKDICASDCLRVMTDPELLQEKEIEVYWNRLSPTVPDAQEDKRILTIEAHDEPCKVGFLLDKDNGCPLCHIESPYSALNDFIDVVDKVVGFRSIEENNA